MKLVEEFYYYRLVNQPCTPYFFDQTLWLPFLSLLVFVQLPFKSGYSLRVAFISWKLIDLNDGWIK